MTTPTFSGWIEDLSKPKDKRLDWSDMTQQFTPGQRVIWERNGFKADAEIRSILKDGKAEVMTAVGWSLAPLSALTPAESLPVQGEPLGYIPKDAVEQIKRPDRIITRGVPVQCYAAEGYEAIYTHPPAQPVQLLQAVDAVLADALNAVSVHPCDEHNESVRATQLHGSMLGLYQIRKKVAAPAQPVQVPGELGIEEAAHRTCSRYVHDKDPSRREYVFLKHTLPDFARALLAASQPAAKCIYCKGLSAGKCVICGESASRPAAQSVEGGA